VSDFFQLGEAEEAARPLDGMNSAEDAGQRILILGIFLQSNQVAVQAVEVFIAFNQEFLNNIAFAHRCFLRPEAGKGPAGGSAVSPCLSLVGWT